MDIDPEKFKNKKIVIMAGGTGGHVFPALAVARKLSSNGAIVFWLGTALGIEAKLIPQEFEIDYIKVKGLRNKGLVKKISFPFSLIHAVLQAKNILKKRKADLVIGFGGYASGPGGLAAYLSKIPLVLHEQNAIPGMTNKYLSKIAKVTLLAFDYRKFGKNPKVVGNPLRSDIVQLAKQAKSFNQDKLNILVVGGSLGAKALNDIVPEALKLMTGKNISVIHQSGEKLLDETNANYNGLSIDYQVQKFIDDMSKAYEWADLIICRSGASTVSEVAAVGLPAIFVPYPHAVDDHQFYNAKFLVDSGAAICVRQSGLSADKLKKRLEDFLFHSEKLKDMSDKLKQLSILDSAERVMVEASNYIK